MKTSVPELRLLISLIEGSPECFLSEKETPSLEMMDAQELIELYFSIKERLRKLGVKPSRVQGPPEKIFITKDYRIRISSRDGKELILSPLVKTVFIFFLKHPEGVELKELPSFEGEMYKIYCRITGRTNLSSIRKSISRLTDIEDNSIHEKCSRLKERLSMYFNEKTLDYYLVKGRYGRGRGIALSREYVVWE